MRNQHYLQRAAWPRRLGLLIAAVALFGVVSLLPAGSPSTFEEHAFRHEGILGTSLDLLVAANNREDAERCESLILGEIERLRLILSTYDSASEVSRLNRAKGPMVCSAELIEVLRGYEVWQKRSGGAFSGQTGGLIKLWQGSAKVNQLPDGKAVRAVLAQLQKPAWHIDEKAHTVERLTDQPLNVNALGRGYILGKAGRLAWEKTPNLHGLLVNHGGDMLALGSSSDAAGWRIGVCDPARPAENSPWLTQLDLKDRAVATSAAYERYLTIDGKRYSHIFDPRTGQPATGVASSTVVAADNATANALATTLCVLTPAEGIKLVESVPGAACLLVTAEGRQLRSRDFERFEVAQPVFFQDKEKGATKWPDGYQVNFDLTLSTFGAGKVRRPYVAVWIEDGDGRAIRTVTVWGRDPRWMKELYQWWKLGSKDASLVRAVTRATRVAGKYSIVWDGLDDKGKAVGKGTYTVQVEVHREHGKYVRQTGKIECKEEGATLTLGKTAETAETLVTFGPKRKEK